MPDASPSISPEARIASAPDEVGFAPRERAAARRRSGLQRGALRLFDGLGRTLLRQELRADLRLDLGRDLGVLDQKLAGVLLALADTLAAVAVPRARFLDDVLADADVDEDRKSTRLNSSHVKISYAVFCL